MSTLLTAQSLHVDTAFGPLFTNLSFTLKKGDRIGLIGYNGCGKSTLLQVLDGTIVPSSGSVALASHCLMARVEQHLPDALLAQPLLQVVLAKLPAPERESQRWQAERLLAEMGFTPDEAAQRASTLSGGQHTRLLLARALIQQPDLLLLDEPGNHLDLPTLLWLESFLQTWQGSFVLVSHDNILLDAVTNASWILRDRTLHAFSLPCSAARRALEEQDASDAQRHKAEQKEIDRVAASAKRLAIWGRTYDNEDLSRKAKQMEKQVQRLKESQTELTMGTPWRLALHGDMLRADRLLEMEQLPVPPAPGLPALFTAGLARLKSGDRVAVMGRNGGGKSSLLRLLWRQMQQETAESGLRLHPRLKPGYYDQTLHQLADDDTLLDALEPFEPGPDARRRALISAGFSWPRHGQKVATLSGGERSRLLFVGLSLARYSLLLLDEPTNHLDIDGKTALAATLSDYSGGLLLVSHDRELINRSCNRFWLIDERGLSEWHSSEEVYEILRTAVRRPATQAVTVNSSEPEEDQDALLERLVTLEQLLADDLARKPKHQKPQLQAQWRKEITTIATLLG
ncbi:ABC-F family ATP-binding cassette domain-containing protein [Klebsiella michiganensis]|uniref:ABC-F family ATP-binding cassette domain-containing protein n=1 Tax=Klebsiella michiganensis TaxID=1134687 RepID=A0AB35WCG6_9ENTR|nr:ABC-F family ATP-binding cassette domain-containing protein [Klebsiella michiganensis]MBL0814111.1 ABC-F family ATP-binding cassette domain-containing protein [Klebsiella michiganensis]MBZ7239242.1 ABC-F family ATP-binding cassette domain-containing protein [Klebsiella michiganensis]MBZ7299057.1 ABC-F family ATP-binding cassette domain-containing protein [Klebsiella michiganensis]MBZ7352687.1 ABC-F family ATP-binding cassette domain-containing protein [Klebsiella michiganensis]MDU1148611.1 